ncbi:MAG: DNA repair protein [Clostridia bacterium]|nr:DNA repair protein [Clostridia bacterium]
MTDRELRKLRREDLLEIMIEQQRQLEELQRQLAEAQEELNDRRIHIDASGSIAEAALRVTHIFEDAQKAADMYLDHVKERTAQQEKELDELERTSRTKMERLLDDAARQATGIVGNARAEAARILDKAQQEA